jgi:hypothetical protein
MSILQKYFKVSNEAKNLYYETHRYTSSNDYIPISEILSLGEASQLSDITYNALTTNHMLVYNDVNDQWENKSGEDVISALGITASSEQLNVLDIDSAPGAGSNNTTNFLRADGTWAAPTVDSITGLTSDASSKQLNVAEDFKFVFEGTTSNDFETTLEVEDPTADREITLPDDFGEISLSPIYTNFYYKAITKTSPFIFTKNNESVALSNPLTNSTFYVTIPNWTTLTTAKSSSDSSLFYGDPARGINLRISRPVAGKVYIAPAVDGDKIEILGNASWDAGENRNASNGNLVAGTVYRILSGSNFPGADNNNVGTYFTATGVGTGTGEAYKAFEISENNFKSGWINITGMKNHGNSFFYWFISKPLQILDSPTLTGTAVLADAEVDELLVKQSVNIQEPSSGGTSTINLKTPALSATYDITLPNVAGVANQLMKSDASGNLSWITVLNENDFASESEVNIPTQNSVKMYIDNKTMSINATSSNANTYTMNNTTKTVTLVSDDFNKTTTINFTPGGGASGVTLYNYYFGISGFWADRASPEKFVYMPPTNSLSLGSKIQLKINILQTAASKDRIYIKPNPNDAKAGLQGATTYASTTPNAVFIESAYPGHKGSISTYDNHNIFSSAELQIYSIINNSTETVILTFELFKDLSFIGPDGSTIEAFVWKRVV